MAFCTKCGCQLADGAKFCFECGTPITTMQDSTQSERETVYEGKIHKCPQCGEVLNAFSANCPACGYELRGTKGTSSVAELALKLQQIEALRPKESGSTIFSQVLQGGNLTDIDSQIVNLIKNFPIPNTKEDVYEFLILASSNIDAKLYGMAYSEGQFQGMLAASQKAISDAWLAKFEQAYQKAMLILNGQELLNIQSLYDLKINQIKKKRLQLPLFLGLGFGGAILLVALIWLMVFLAGSI